MAYFAGIIISFFLFALLFLKKNKSTADKILAGWIALITVHQSLFYLYYTDQIYEFPHLLGFIFPLPILHSVFLFLYVSAITRPRPLPFKVVLLHLIPFLSVILLALPFYILPAAEKILIFQNEGAGFEGYLLYKGILITLSGPVYAIWSWILIRKYRNQAQQTFSNLDRKYLRWLELLTIAMGLIWLVTFFFDDTVIFSGVIILVLFIGFFGINQLPIFISANTFEYLEAPESPLEPVETAANSKPEESPKRYAKSGLKAGDVEEIYQALTQLMEENALYENSDLTLAELASHLDIHPNYVSQVINEKEQKNFYQFVNTLRVEAFIRKASLPENRKFTLLALAMECGFNSKSTFNKYFKTVTGKTPSAYFPSNNP